ncbi:ATP-binding protein, partial [Streptomyces sp. MCAF7]
MLPGTVGAPAAARAFVRTTLTGPGAPAGSPTGPGERPLGDRLTEDAVLLVSELVTNAVLHAGTEIEVVCRLQTTPPGVVVEVSDLHPASA